MGADVEDETALPPLPNAPRNETTCSDAAFATFAADAAASSSTPYKATKELWGSCGGGWGTPGTPCLRGVLSWSQEASGVVHAQVVANGQFGWLAFGHENPGGGHNGMDGQP